jgi:hypothetical protein
MGVVLQIIGAGIMAGAWPGEEVESGYFGSSDTLVATGSTWGTLLGLAIATLGFFMVFVAVIARGVKMGREASADVAA